MIWLVVACGPAALTPAPAPAPEARAQLSARRVEADQNAELGLVVGAPPGWTYTAEEPAVDGLLLAPLEASAAGPRWTVGGPPGSYVLPPLTVTFTGPEGQVEERQTSPLYLDIGVQGPSSELESLAVAPVEAERARWPWLVGAGGLVCAGVGLAWLARQRAAATPRLPPPPVPADREALEAWEAARGALAQDEHALALALSALFRRYLERVAGVQALTLTSEELLARLGGRPGWDQALLTRAGRLLGATDLIKFAHQGGGRALFELLDADLRAVIAATRPVEAPHG